MLRGKVKDDVKEVGRFYVASESWKSERMCLVNSVTSLELDTVLSNCWPHLINGPWNRFCEWWLTFSHPRIGENTIIQHTEWILFKEMCFRYV